MTDRMKKVLIQFHSNLPLATWKHCRSASPELVSKLQIVERTFSFEKWLEFSSHKQFMWLERKGNMKIVNRIQQYPLQNSLHYIRQNLETQVYMHARFSHELAKYLVSLGGPDYPSNVL